MMHLCLFLFTFCFGSIKMESTEQHLPTDEYVSQVYEDVNNETIVVQRNADSIELNSDAEEEDIYDDQMKIFIFTGAEFRSAISNKGRIWANGIVPYEISSDYKPRDRKLILDSMEEFRNKTCIRFRPRRGEKSYILIMPGRGCSAVVGKIPTANRISLGENCLVKGIVLHELMHALGFIHEQNRSDRDQFVRINTDNIREGAERNFVKMQDVLSFNQTYDYGSVMHYGAFDFAKDRSKPTIVTLQKDVIIGQRRGFSEKDLIKINFLYDCENRKNSGNETEETSEEKKIQKGNGNRNEKTRMKLPFAFFEKFIELIKLFEDEIL